MHASIEKPELKECQKQQDEYKSDRQGRGITDSKEYEALLVDRVQHHLGCAPWPALRDRRYRLEHPEGSQKRNDDDEDKGRPEQRQRYCPEALIGPIGTVDGGRIIKVARNRF